MSRSKLHAVLPVLVLFMLLEAELTAEQAVLMEKTAPGVVDKLVVMDGPWQRSAVEAKLRRFYSANRGQFKLFRLTIVPRKEGAYRVLSHGANVATYDYTVAELERLGPPVGPVGQVLGLGESAVMMYREGDVFSQEVLGDLPSPTTLTIHGRYRFRLLAFWLTVSRQTQPVIFGLTLSIKSEQPVSLAACASLTDSLGRRLALPSSSVDIRPDEWFMESTGFPSLYPFAKGLRVPTESEYRLASTVICGYSKEHGVTCSGQSFRP